MSDDPRMPGLFGPLLLDFWNQKYIESGRDNREMSVPDAVFRHSWAGSCARRIQYEMQNYSGEREFDLPVRAPADRWRLEMGTLVHDYWQAALTACLPEATIEHVTSHPIDDAHTAGHGDALINHPQLGRVAVELKTRNGFGYKQDIGANKYEDAEGPSVAAKRQGALNALAEDADWLVILHISLEAVGPNQLPGQHKGDNYSPLRMTAEWWYSKEEYTPWATHELQRVSFIKKIIDNKELAPRHVPELMPSGARIVDVNKSQWYLEENNEVVSIGQLWNGRFCSYCPYVNACMEDG